MSHVTLQFIHPVKKVISYHITAVISIHLLFLSYLFHFLLAYHFTKPFLNIILWWMKDHYISQSKAISKSSSCFINNLQSNKGLIRLLYERNSCFLINFMYNWLTQMVTWSSNPLKSSTYWEIHILWTTLF